MADSPRRRYSRSPLPYKGRSTSRSKGQSQSRSRSPRPRSRSRSQSPSHNRNDVANSGNTLYVTGLSSRVTERDLEEHFSKEGKVTDCRLIVEPRTRISRGFAFLTMETTEAAERCVRHLNQSVLEGRYITVEKSRRKRPRTPTPGQYLGLKNSREPGYRYDRDRDRGRFRGGYGRDEYYGGYRRSPRRSPYRGGRDYSPPRYSPYGGRSRRERSRSLPDSPYGSPDRGGYGKRSNMYVR
ncbi:serine/arginine-rich splicing factor SR45a-like [Phalaenopsis equestris]|uniref:serine/arginine-rich splicing factor SR45a-like n=1 Tax=Phalaenopsis equestris TaxID=78828 RepID=UPI0009E4CEB5|nr:serine/arginine-rich splicing factor SR45a-like [Phalaenopsis equestris]